MILIFVRRACISQSAGFSLGSNQISPLVLPSAESALILPLCISVSRYLAAEWVINHHPPLYLSISRQQVYYDTPIAICGYPCMYSGISLSHRHNDVNRLFKILIILWGGFLAVIIRAGVLRDN